METRRYRLKSVKIREIKMSPSNSIDYGYTIYGENTMTLCA